MKKAVLMILLGNLLVSDLHFSLAAQGNIISESPTHEKFSFGGGGRSSGGRGGAGGRGASGGGGTGSQGKALPGSGSESGRRGSGAGAVPFLAAGAAGAGVAAAAHHYGGAPALSASLPAVGLVVMGLSLWVLLG